MLHWEKIVQCTVLEMRHSRAIVSMRSSDSLWSIINSVMTKLKDKEKSPYFFLDICRWKCFFSVQWKFFLLLLLRFCTVIFFSNHEDHMNAQYKVIKCFCFFSLFVKWKTIIIKITHVLLILFIYPFFYECPISFVNLRAK